MIQKLFDSKIEKLKCLFKENNIEYNEMTNPAISMALSSNNNFVGFVSNLTDEEINNIVSYILSLTEDGYENGVEILDDGIYEVINKIRLDIGKDKIKTILSSERVNQLKCFLE